MCPTIFFLFHLEFREKKKKKKRKFPSPAPESAHLAHLAAETGDL